MGEIETVTFQFKILIFKRFHGPPPPLSGTHQN